MKREAPQATNAGETLAALSGVELLVLCERDAATSPAAAELVRRIERYLDGVSAQSLASHLDLPEGRSRLRLYQRNTWLVRAAQTVAAPNPWQGCCSLAGAWHAFVDRGTFARLRGLPLHPPRSSRDQQACLFHATVANDGNALTASRLYQLKPLRNVWGVEVETVAAEQSLIATERVTP